MISTNILKTAKSALAKMSAQTGDDMGEILSDLILRRAKRLGIEIKA